MRSSSLMIVVCVLFVLVVTNLFTAATTLWLVRRSQPVAMPRFQPQDPLLINAIMSGATDREIEEMLKEGESASVRRSDSAPAIVVAAEQNRPDLVRLLVQYGASVNELTYQDFSALHIAAVQDLATCAVLLELGANVNARTAISGATPLLDAATDGNASITQLLLDRGADPCAQGVRGRTIVQTIEEYMKSGTRMDATDVSVSLQLIRDAAARKGC